MNVFVLNTGRCGSTTFIKACKHITNFSAGHETRTALLDAERLDYPDQHIEADNRLSWLLGRLDRKYGENAYYIHLKRDREATAKSLAARYWTGIMLAYRGNGVLMGLPDQSDPMAVSRDYCDTITSNIELFLRDKPKVMVVHLESIAEDFARFWTWINAEGNLDAAIAELGTTHNRGGERAHSLLTRGRNKLKRTMWRHLMRTD